MAVQKGEPRKSLGVFGKLKAASQAKADSTIDFRNIDGAFGALPAAATMVRYSPERAFSNLVPIHLDADHLERNHVMAEAERFPIASKFDILRTSLLHGLTQRGWHRIGITSPTPGCGKTFMAANLAMSLARRPESRTFLLDFDFAKPDLSHSLGVTENLHFTDFLHGIQPAESMLRRFGPSLALGLNTGHHNDQNAADLHVEETHEALHSLMTQFEPEVVLFDLPPVLSSDAVIAMARSLDAVLLVTDGRKSSPVDIAEAESSLKDRIPLLGVVLNRAEDLDARRFFNRKS